jgi:HEAT repeat protein
VHERFDAMQPALVRQLKSRRVDERVSAIETLRRFPVAESTRLVHGCFIDKDDAVRSAAYEALQAMNDQQEVCDALVTLAESSLKNSKRNEMVIPALAALLSSELPLAQTRAQEFLDRDVSRSPLGPEILVLLADNLGAHAKASDVAPLARLSNTRLFAEHFGVRRAVVQALTKTPAAESIETLIGVMDSIGGEAKADAAAYLSRITGQRLGMNVDAWKKWRKASAAPGQVALASINPSDLTATVKRAEEVDSEGGHYYGIPLYAERLVFVLDVSGSMQGGRMVAAKRELLKSIEGLMPKAKFGIVVFNNSVARWQHSLVEANAKNKRLAAQFVERQNPQASTASFDALAAALEFDVEAIYFLTDGAPTCGKILAPVDIVRSVTGTNRVRRISIYTIGIAPGYPGSPTDAFLKKLAEENLGSYRRIDG